MFDVVGFVEYASFHVVSVPSVSSCNCFGWLVPFSLGVKGPLAWVVAHASAITCIFFEVLSERVHTRQIFWTFGSTETSDQLPALFVRFVPGCVFCLTNKIWWLSLDQESVGSFWFPWELFMAVTAWTFTPKVLSDYFLSLAEQFDSLILGNFFRVVSLEWAPHRENNSPFGLTIDLHAEVTVIKSIGHEVSTNGILALWNFQFRIPVVHLDILWILVPNSYWRTPSTEMHAWFITSGHVINFTSAGDLHSNQFAKCCELLFSQSYEH